MNEADRPATPISPTEIVERLIVVKTSQLDHYRRCAANQKTRWSTVLELELVANNILVTSTELDVLRSLLATLLLSK